MDEKCLMSGLKRKVQVINEHFISISSHTQPLNTQLRYSPESGSHLLTSWVYLTFTKSMLISVDLVEFHSREMVKHIHRVTHIDSCRG